MDDYITQAQYKAMLDFYQKHGKQQSDMQQDWERCILTVNNLDGQTIFWWLEYPSDADDYGIAFYPDGTSVPRNKLARYCGNID